LAEELDVPDFPELEDFAFEELDLTVVSGIFMLLDEVCTNFVVSSATQRTEYRSFLGDFLIQRSGRELISTA
jgi:CRISPR/Cas system-associated endonuclease/helicase Cas3